MPQNSLCKNMTHQDWVALGRQWETVWQAMSFVDFCRLHGLNPDRCRYQLKKLGYRCRGKAARSEGR